MTADRKAVLVTGAASGIGRAAAERLARNGWRVLAVDRDGERLAWTESVEHVSALAADVSSEEDNRRMAETADAQFSGLDAVIFNAGVRGGGSIEALPFADFQKVISINLFGAVLGIKATLPLLRRRSPSSIAITSSTMGLAGDADNWAYCASKHALIGLVRSLARELGWENIRINALCPGPTRTGMTGAVETEYPQIYESIIRSVPLQRWAEPDEMAAVLEFLISPAASYVNGVALAADGGAMLGTGLMPPSSGTTAASARADRSRTF